MTDEQKPLMDDELRALVEWFSRPAGGPQVVDLVSDAVLAALVDLRRLRSDEWLERAIQEIAIGGSLSTSDDCEDALSTLRKHRDGKA